MENTEKQKQNLDKHTKREWKGRCPLLAKLCPYQFSGQKLILHVRCCLIYIFHLRV